MKIAVANVGIAVAARSTMLPFFREWRTRRP